MLKVFLLIYTTAQGDANPSVWDRWWQASLQFPTEQTCVEASKSFNDWATRPDLRYTPHSRIVSTDCSDVPYPPMYQKNLEKIVKYSLTPPGLPIEGPYLTFYTAAVEGYEVAPYAGITIKFPTKLACKKMSDTLNSLPNGPDIKYVPGSLEISTRCKRK